MSSSLRFHRLSKFVRRVVGPLASVGVFVTLLAPSIGRADDLASLARVQRPFTIYGAIGQPAPAWIGLNLAYQVHAGLQIVAGTGYFWSNELKIQSFSAAARIHILPFEVSPMLGAGVSYFKLNGDHNLQGLNESTVLGLLQVGVDYCTDFGLRLGAGWSFHFPLNLNFPFAEVGFSF